nr:ParB/RepB/Spo0J family partition protein [Pseudoclavibacter sp. Marseille-Q3772]
MATKKRTGLGRGLSALIPSTPPTSERDIDVFFNGSAPTGRSQSAATTAAASSRTTPKKPATAGTTTQRTAAAKPASTSSNKKTAASNSSKKRSKSTSKNVDSSKREASRKRSESTANTKPNTNNAAEQATPEQETELLPVPGARLAELDPYRIVPNAKQPRQEFDEEALDELIVSVREFGVLQPIVVRPLASEDPRVAEGEYELIMGERRLRATKASGRTSIPAIIRDTNDEDMLRDALLENLHRAELNPLEEASAYRQLLDDFGCTQDELAERISRSRPQISNTLRLLNLPVEVQRRVAAGVLSAGHARAVLSVGEPVAMAQLADKIVNEQLSVRQAEAAAATAATRAGRSAPRREQHSDSLTAHLNELGERLGDRLNTRVQVSLRKTKGTIRIDFASMADLNRILEELGEEAAQ